MTKVRMASTTIAAARNSITLGVLRGTRASARNFPSLPGAATAISKILRLPGIHSDVSPASERNSVAVLEGYQNIGFDGDTVDLGAVGRAQVEQRQRAVGLPLDLGMAARHARI